MNKVIVVAGATGGMGKEIVNKFLSSGDKVYGLDIKDSDLEKANYVYIKTNLTKSEDVNKVYETIKNNREKIDVIINAAGIYDLNSLVEISEEDFIKIFNINVFSSYRLNKTLLPLLNEKGRIVIISSELGPLDPLPFTGLYGITKSTVEKYAYSLRMELQLLGYKVILVRPGAIDTGLLNVSTQKLEEFTNTTKYYKYNAKKFKDVIDSVENKKIPPSKIAQLIYKAVNKKKPKYVYIINRNFWLLLLNALPQKVQNYIIKKILTSK